MASGVVGDGDGDGAAGVWAAVLAWLASEWAPLVLGAAVVLCAIVYARFCAGKRLHYADAKYWDQRYLLSSKHSIDNYEWYSMDDALVDETLAIVRGVAGQSKVPIKILELGCGQSRLGQQLVDAGFLSVTCTDFSPVVIAQRRKEQEGTKSAYGARPVAYLCADAANMPMFDDGHFDVVVEKATLDSMTFGTPEHMRVVARELCRVLRPGGVLVSVSNAPPEMWLRHWNCADWIVDSTKGLVRVVNGQAINVYVHTVRRIE